MKSENQDIQVKKIDNRAFYENSDIINIVFSKLDKNQWISIDNYAFEGCSNLESIDFNISPHSSDGKDRGIEEIGEQAFASCSKLDLSHVDFSEFSMGPKVGLEYVGNGEDGVLYLNQKSKQDFWSGYPVAINDNSGLSSGFIDLAYAEANVTSISNLNYTNAKIIKLPETLTFIDRLALSYNIFLTKIYFPQNFFYSPGLTFLNCPLLKDFYMGWNEEQLLKAIELNKQQNGAFNRFFCDLDYTALPRIKYVNRKDVTIHLPSNASSSLIQLYKDTFKEYDEETEIGWGLDTKTLHWAYDANPIYIPQTKIDVLPIIAIVISSISLLGGSTMFGYWLKNRKN